MAASAQLFTALVLAADRGAGDPVSRTAGVAHKCLAPVAGKPMVERVVAALAASPTSIASPYRCAIRAWRGRSRPWCRCCKAGA